MFIVGVMFVYAEFGAVVSVQSVFGGYLWGTERNVY